MVVGCLVGLCAWRLCGGVVVVRCVVGKSGAKDYIGNKNNTEEMRK